MAQINKPSEYFNTKLWTGTGAENAITGVGFQPDWVWIKNRDAVEHNKLYDAVRGATKNIYSNLTNAEGTDAQSLKSFDSDGFTLGTESALNGSGQEIVGWSWKANGAGVSNTDGSLTSTVSANTTSGFSIVRFTGNETAGATVGHGLGVAPDVVIAKPLQRVESWRTYHKDVGANYNLNLEGTAGASLNSSIWSNTAPNSTVVTLGENSSPNPPSETCILYCFAEKKGFSKFGSYTGNGNDDGTFIYTGFKPAFVMLKEASGASVSGSWLMIDNKRDTFNLAGTHIAANSSGAEQTAASRSPTFGIDFISNGFKLRGSHDEINTSDYTYIYMAFAEQPLVGTNNIPATAR